MTVTNMTLFKNNFHPKVDLLYRKFKENEDGEFVEVIEELGTAWAKVQSISRFSKRYKEDWHNVEQTKVLQIYKVVMRKTINRNARHAYLNALRWNYKILDIFDTFQTSDCGNWLEGIAVEYKKEDEHG